MARCFIWNIWACHSSFNSICSLWTQLSKNDGSFTYWLNYLSVYYLLIWTLGTNCGERYEASVSLGSLWKVQRIRSHPGSPELESYFNKSTGGYSLKKGWLLATCLSLFFMSVPNEHAEKIAKKYMIISRILCRRSYLWLTMFHKQGHSDVNDALFSKDALIWPNVTQLWRPEWFQTPLIDILNTAWKCCALQNPSSQEYICLKVGCPNGGASPPESKTPHFHLFKANPHFLVQRGISLLFPVTWVLLLGNAPSILSFGLCTTWTAPWKDYADNKPQSYQAVAIYPGIMLCEWLTGKAQGDLVTGKGCHLFIYFPPCVTNSKNRPLFGNRSTREQEEFC